MPKLSTAMAKAVDAADAIHESGFVILAPGRYIAELEEVVARDDRNGNPGWNTSWIKLTGLDGTIYPGKQFMWLTLPQKKPARMSVEEADKYTKGEAQRRGQLRAFFESLGFEVGSDTDEMLGSKATLVIDVKKAAAGKNQGKDVNVVRGIYPAEISGEAAGVFAGEGEDAEDDDDSF